MPDVFNYGGVTCAAVPAALIPSYRTFVAAENGVEKNLLLKTWGGLGDQICAEPTLRYALSAFKGCSISLASEHPELFQHLKFAAVFDLKDSEPNYSQFLTFDMIRPPSDLSWEFTNHMLTNCVDYPALCAFRCQLPVPFRRIQLKPSVKDYNAFMEHAAKAPYPGRPMVAIHAGRHWQSKTFPADWWDAVINHVLAGACQPVLIGGDTDDNRGTVDVDTGDCLDLRGKLGLMESVAFLLHVPVLLTNDSAPLHMAAAGRAWIGYVATCKHPDMITHWRAGGWSWRMKNHGKGGIWDVISHCPNHQGGEVSAENVGDELLRSWLPDPKDFATWAIERAKLPIEGKANSLSA